jgi:hypothetical protein
VSNKAYLVCGGWAYEGDEPLVAFSTRAAAEQFITATRERCTSKDPRGYHDSRACNLATCVHRFDEVFVREVEMHDDPTAVVETAAKVDLRSVILPDPALAHLVRDKVA